MRRGAPRRAESMTPPDALRPPAFATAPRPRGTDGPVVPLAPGGLDRAAAVLARAFHEDPVMVHSVPDPARRPAALKVCFRSVLRYALRHGAVDSTPGGEGVLVRVGPGAAPASMAGMLRAGFLAWPGAFGAAGFGRVVRVMGTMDALHHRHAAGPHWYFWAMGVEAEARHGGLGARLLRHGLARADAEGLPVYAETFQPRMLPYLARFGFEVVEEVQAAGGGPRTWAVLRAPRAAPQGRA